jgi:hypothetical protein
MMRVISLQCFGPEIAADTVAAQRQRQLARFHPPRAQVNNEVQTEFLVGKLTFVDQQPGIGFAHLSPRQESRQTS